MGCVLRHVLLKGRFLMCIVNAHCNCFRHTAISKFKIVLSDDEEESWAAMYYTVCVWLCDTLLDTHFILSVETRTLLRENASFNCIVMSQALKLCVLMYIAVFWCILQIKHQLHLSICRMEFCLDSGWTKYHREVSRCLLEPREWITVHAGGVCSDSCVDLMVTHSNWIVQDVVEEIDMRRTFSISSSSTLWWVTLNLPMLDVTVLCYYCKWLLLK